MTDQGRRLPGPLLPLSGFAAAALFGFLVLPLLAEYRWRLLGFTEYRTWQVLVVLQATLWILAVFYTLGVQPRLAAARARAPRIATVLFLILTVLPFLFFKTNFPISESRAAPVVPLPVIFGALASAIVCAGIFRIHLVANDWLLKRFGPDNPTGTYKELSDHLERHLLLLGAILAATVIGAKAAHQAFLAVDERELFPAKQVWQLAVYWSTLLAVVYWGSRSALRRIGCRLRDQLLAGAPSDPGSKERVNRESAVDETLGLRRSYIAELQSVFSVLTPIVGAVASQLI